MKNYQADMKNYQADDSCYINDYEYGFINN